MNYPTTEEKLEELKDMPRRFWAQVEISEKLHKENTEARNALIALDRAMAGVMEYEHAWMNAPEKPEMTPAKMVRDILSNAKVSGTHPTIDDNQQEDVAG